VQHYTSPLAYLPPPSHPSAPLPASTATMGVTEIKSMQEFKTVVRPVCAVSNVSD
jgi:hypothetical protein